jgi:hypothetical protein
LRPILSLRAPIAVETNTAGTTYTWDVRRFTARTLIDKTYNANIGEKANLLGQAGDTMTTRWLHW